MSDASSAGRPKREAPPPHRLYKYRSLAAGQTIGFTRDIILNNRLFWPSPTQFNDPFDCLPNVQFQGSRLRKSIYLRDTFREVASGLPRWERKRQERHAQGKSRFVYERGVRDTARQIREKIGVCSLTERGDHLLMWGHYADSHHGICLEFDTVGVPFCLAMQVVYSAVRPVIEITARNRNPDIIDKMMLTKAELWEYEREWRIIDHAQAGLHSFPPGCLNRIIFGAAISAEDRDEVVGWTKDRPTRVSFAQATIDDALFELRIDPI